MFYMISGELTHKAEDFVVIKTGGVSFKLSISLRGLAGMGAIGKEISLYTYMHVREEAITLFGFIDEQELKSFKMLLSVSGVGIKAGLALMSELSPDRLAIALASGDIKALQSAPGIGPKTAKRIILELQDKIKTDDISPSALSASMGGGGGGAGAIAEAMNALGSLGYSQSEAAVALSGLPEGKSVEELIKLALKKTCKRLKERGRV